MLQNDPSPSLMQLHTLKISGRRIDSHHLAIFTFARDDLSYYPDLVVCLGIFILLMIDSIICFMEDKLAESKAAPLMAKLYLQSKVLRDGTWIKMDAAMLVPGDIIGIKAGDIIPADVRLLEGDPLMFDQSAITGASLAVRRNPGDVVFSGSTCKQGEIKAIVIGTGIYAFTGQVPNLVDGINKVDHFHEAHIAFLCFYLSAGISMGIIFMSIQQRKYNDGIENLFALLVGGIPISMPTVLSVIRALGLQSLSEQGAIIKRTSLIDRMASMDIVCSEMTGTLTLNKLTVEKSAIEVFAEGVSREDVILIAARASRASSQDPVDNAILALLSDPMEARFGIRELHFSPFNSLDKRTTVTYINEDGNWQRASKGAFEEILDLCNCKQSVRNKVLLVINRYAKRGFRSLAVARQDIPEKMKESDAAPWQFVGLLPLFHPPRYDIVETIQKAFDLGLDVKITTGDQVAISKETGCCLGLGTDFYPFSSLVFCYRNMPTDGLSADELIERADEFAGVHPEHKYEIVEKLQKGKHICGTTGDGLDDAPALRRADIGFTVVDGADAAICASDIILTEPGLGVIISVILTSRAIFRKMKYYTEYSIAIALYLVLAFLLITVVWKFDVSFIMVFIIVILNHGAVVTLSKVRMKPSPLPDSWKLKEIFAYGILMGSYLVLMTVIFFWAMQQSEFFMDTFGVKSLKHNPGEMMAALFLQVGIMSQLLILVTRSRSWSFVEWPGLTVIASFTIVQAVVTLVAVYVNWACARIRGIGWGWAGVIWIYCALSFFPLEAIKCVLRYISEERANHCKKRLLQSRRVKAFTSS